MIRSFADRNTQKLFSRNFVRKFSSFEEKARKALAVLNAATSLNDLAAVPGNRLEKLPEYGGKYGLRINNKWRLLFNWSAPHAYDVEIKDYH